ncbi:gamma-glutamylcyclotransferase family protein [Duganella sp. BuS-21]|uniref:gamma-glutamylcyclotransferase family protein n=1 Tax=Duganella sp. BuS-21 TaxID=2943848 RepID=UPI0035A5E41A
MTKIYYLAYGSNLHPARLVARVPSARVVGVVEMPGFVLAFHKRSVDSSGKCLLYSEQGASHKAFGVLYEFDAHDKANLDAVEGKGKGYIEKLVQFHLNGQTYTPYIYIAESTHIDGTLIPYHWYKSLVLIGARYHGFPPEYVATIEATPSKRDPDAIRTQENEKLLAKMTMS